MKKVLVSLVTAAMMVTLIGCQGKTAATETAATQGSKETTVASIETKAGENKKDEVKTVKSMVVVLPNVRGDGGTHDLACRAAEAISSRIGAKMDIVELGTAVTDSAKWEAGMSDLCEEGYDLIITGGSLMKDTIQAVAPMYKDLPFICYDVNLDFDKVEMPNVYSMDFHQNEAAFMAGVIAASMSKTDYIGFIGATKIPVIYDFMVGYISGAKAVKPDIRVAVAFTNDYNDATLAKELSLAQISDGADVLFPACGNAAAGVYEAARDKKIWAVGNDQDVAKKYVGSDQTIADAVLTSVMKKVDNAVIEAFGKYEVGTLPFGKQETIGVATDGAGVVKNEYYEKQLPDEVKKTVENYENKIKSGEQKVPSAIGMDAAKIDELINSAK